MNRTDRGLRRRVVLAAPLLLAVGWLAMPVAAQVQGDVAAGRQRAQMCATCHGLDGMARLPDAPNIGGESAIYLERQLEAFRSGERRHEQMSIIAQTLSDADIADLAAYYSAIEVEVTGMPE